MSAETIEDLDYDTCGTYSGWNKHQKDRTRICEPCKAARREYMREYMREYRKRPGKKEEAVALTRAHSRALWRLAHLHPAQFRALVDEERAAPDPTAP